MIYVGEILMLLCTFVVADIHANRYDDNKPIGRLWHPLWAAPFVVFIVAAWFVTKSWQATASIALVRALFFNPILNLLRKNITAAGFLNRWFYLHGESENGSWIDRQLEKAKWLYPMLWLAGLVFFIILQFNM